MPNLTRFKGWRFDPDNNRLDFYYNGNRLGHVDANSTDFVAAAAMSAGLTISDGSLNVSSTDAHTLDGTDLSIPNAPTSDPSATNQVFSNTDVLTISTP